MLRVVEHCSFSDTGRQRRVNEDAFLSRAPLFAVADGMGGAKAGEIASRTAIDVIGLGVESGVVRSRLVELVRRANRAVHESQLADDDLAGMGTTATVAHVGERALTVAHVGDSRAYLLRDGGLRRLTDDHSLVEEMRRSGRLTAEEAANHPQRSIITRALGPEPTVDVDVREFELIHGDVVLLCSDGLTSMIPESRIGELISGNARLDNAGRALIAAANAAGGRDNITVVLMRIGDPELDAATPPGEEPTVAGGADRASTGDLTAVTEAVAVAERPRTQDVRAAAVAVAEEQASQARPVAPREPAARTSRAKRRRAIAAVLATTITVALFGTVFWIATRVTYFIGSSQGYVAIYQGFPYDLPLGITLYRPVYRSGVPVSSLEQARQEKLFDHQLRSGDDAQDLIRAVERDELR